MSFEFLESALSFLSSSEMSNAVAKSPSSEDISFALTDLRKEMKIQIPKRTTKKYMKKEAQEEGGSRGRSQEE